MADNPSPFAPEPRIDREPEKADRALRSALIHCQRARTELSSRAIRSWRNRIGAIRHHMAPRQTAHHAFIERLNGRLHDKPLVETVFSTFADAQRKMSTWRLDYNNSDRMPCVKPIDSSSNEARSPNTNA